ncbi:glycosyltransferase family A protein [Altererythrobacter sp.]|uniref:glycosyltransferase n=1 Tax=Altererythrobacter sp. TaxID=1872480 RepID=UPI001B1214DD|nr:glycosyltransferase family A protein [Altererythrobacter sp.]MBO6609857.1 glycosyltransferase family 2 protein [Altererythrobacter sp.]MBO6642213.1 glycosyltransferase family 2 protein [Altererythrobacter sp.]MBO6709279.1 glycosyltransferase family 2 protein [Altererythrobacter sp.]
MTDISIIIRTLNEAKWLPELLSAIEKQETAGLAYNVVLVDSGSTDGTLEIAKQFGCQIETIDKSEFTFGRSLNVGCDAAPGRYLVMISGHCIPVGADWLLELCLPLENGQCDYSYGRQIWREGYSKYSEQQLFQKYFPEKSQMPQDGFFCNNANSAVSKKAWSQFRFDEEVTGLEDMVLAKQICEAGGKIGYVADSVVEHIHEETWPQVKRRYEREAIALQGIMPEVHVTFFDFLRYTTAGIMLDMSAALQEKRLLKEFKSIVLFRTMQFWGTYRGNNDHRKLSRQKREKYFYPK